MQKHDTESVKVINNVTNVKKAKINIVLKTVRMENNEYQDSRSIADTIPFFKQNGNTHKMYNMCTMDSLLSIFGHLYLKDEQVKN